MDLKGKVVLVTGASRGIGAATAKTLADAGATVIVHFHSDEKNAKKTASACRTKHVLKADLTDLDECRKLVEEAAKIGGGLDGLVNNAGMSTNQQKTQELADQWNELNALNLRAPFFLSQYAKEHMKNGVIVNISSIRAFRPKDGLNIYGTTKAALSYATRSLAKAFAPDIRVNAVAPGYVHTEMLDKFYGDQIPELKKEVPLGRLIKPEEIAHAVRFLFENDALTGHVLVVDGGYLLG